MIIISTLQTKKTTNLVGEDVKISVPMVASEFSQGLEAAGLRFKKIPAHKVDFGCQTLVYLFYAKCALLLMCNELTHLQIRRGQSRQLHNPPLLHWPDHFSIGLDNKR